MSGRHTKTKWLSRDLAAPGPCLCLCLSQKELSAVARLLNAPFVDYLNPGANATTHIFTKEGKALAAVCLGPVDGMDGQQIAAMLVHEAVHVWQEYVRNIGERTPGDEQEAYAIQAISQELMTEYARRLSTN